jgi:glutaredoxin
VSGPAHVTLYGRPGCHLCDDALLVLERVRAEHEFALETVNIEDDDALFRAYLERIPVVSIDGDEVYDYHVDEADLRSRLARVGRR